MQLYMPINVQYLYENSIWQQPGNEAVMHEPSTCLVRGMHHDKEAAYSSSVLGGRSSSRIHSKTADTLSTARRSSRASSFPERRGQRSSPPSRYPSTSGHGSSTSTRWKRRLRPLNRFRASYSGAMYLSHGCLSANEVAFPAAELLVADAIRTIAFLEANGADHGVGDERDRTARPADTAKQTGLRPEKGGKQPGCSYSFDKARAVHQESEPGTSNYHDI
eukprot:scaffold3307_cov265-Pinguiococcus_pyrenoidosus.AAC.5